MKKLTSVATVLLMAVSMAMAADPVVLVQRGTMEAGVAANVNNNQFAHAIDGQTSYHSFLSRNITKVETINGVQTPSVFISTADWNAASGEKSLTPQYGFAISGNYLVMAGAATHAVWKADLATGAISPVVSQAAIGSYVGLTGTNTASIVVAQSLAPNGGLTFRESKTNTILNVDLDGTLSTVLESSVLKAVTGSDVILSGLAYDSLGSMYWSHNTATDPIYRLTAGGTIELVMDNTALLALSGKADAQIWDMMVGADQRLYFVDNTSKGIYAVDPMVGASSLEQLVVDTESIITLGWYNDGSTDYVTYNTYKGDLMAIAIPEPATLGLLAAGGLGLLRRRRS